MTKQLLNRQTKLLDYLTSGATIFGDSGDVPLAVELQGIDPVRLRLEARFSHEKRLEKITTVFPRTFEVLGTKRESVLRAFVESCPPLHIGRMENARQFRDFLIARRRFRPPIPRYLPDVAACELACAEVRTRADVASASGAGAVGRAARRVRRDPGVVLHRASFDVRKLFEGSPDTTAMVERDTPLAITFRDGAARISEILPEIFDLLAALDGWVTVDELPDAVGLIADLAQAGLLEPAP